MTTQEAVKAAQDILKDDANELACLGNDENAKKLPHRAKVAIRREIDRLRAISDALGVGLGEQGNDSEPGHSPTGPNSPDGAPRRSGE